MTNEPEQPTETDDHEQHDQDGGGQVSEVSGMEAASAGEPVMPDQAVAGAPDADSGETQEGGTGPNARPHHNRADEDDPEQEPGRKD